jgi:hypothetical protein
LKVLNIANNDLGFIDYHMFSTLESLTTWDISGNNLTKLKDHETFKEIFPSLTRIGLENNFWNCEYLSKLRLSLEKQGIKIDDAKNLVKNGSSIKGIGCSTATNSRIDQLLTDDDSLKTLEKLNEVIATTNSLIAQVNDIKSNESSFKELIFNLQKDIFADNFDDKKQIVLYSKIAGTFDSVASEAVLPSKYASDVLEECISLFGIVFKVGTVFYSLLIF